MSFFSAASTIGVAVSPPILAAMMLVMGWREMFITIGKLGIFLAIGWYMLYRNREHVELTAVEQTSLCTQVASMPAGIAQFCQIHAACSVTAQCGE